MVTHEQARVLLTTYQEAWVEQDPDLILSIFHEDASYHERAFEPPFRGHEEIRTYWQEKVVQEQQDIEFELLNTYVDGDTIIAEWEVRLFSAVKQQRLHMKEVAILEVRGQKIQSLREYWQSVWE